MDPSLIMANIAIRNKKKHKKLVKSYLKSKP
jgi:hypothetical protein